LHFKAYFHAYTVDRPGVDNLQFWTFSHAKGGGLINHFSKEKVKVVVWDCYRFKGPVYMELISGSLRSFGKI